MEPIAVTDVSINRSTPSLDARLAARLSAVIRRLRAYLLLEGAARLAAFLAAAAALQFAIDYSTRGVRWSMRATILAVIVVFALRIAWRRIVSITMVPIDTADAAKLVERRYPQLASSLISAVRFSAGQVGSLDSNSPELMTAAARKAVDRAAPLDFHAVLIPAGARRGGFALAGILATAFTTWTLAPELAGLWLRRNVLLQEVPWPKRTRLVVNLPNGELIGAKGDDLSITARVEGVRPGEVQVRYVTESGRRGFEVMSAVGKDEQAHYRLTFKNAREDFTFQLLGGDDETEVFSTRLVDRPRVESATIHVEPPHYARLDSVTVGDAQRAVQALPGSRVTIRIRTNKPVAQATLFAGESSVADAAPKDGAYEAAFIPRESQTYHFALKDELGLEDRQPAKFSIRMLQDDPPRVRLRAAGVGEMVTPEAVLPLQTEYSDTYGLAQVELLFTIMRDSDSGGPIHFPGFKPGLKTFASSLEWNVAEAGVIPGDRLVLVTRAEDFDDVSGPNSAASPEIHMRVVSKEELLAELARREHEYRMDFERLIDAQEQLRGRLLTVMDSSDSKDQASAASNLERRQRGIGGSVNVVRQQFEQVIGEMRINRVSDATVEERLGRGIVNPLNELARRGFPAAADEIRQWSRSGSREAAANMDAQQVTLLKQMREILANMVQWQGYQEAVTMLRDVMRLQEELKSETKQKLKEQGKGLFDD